MYVSLAQAKEFMGVTTTTDDALITALIEQISEMIDGLIGRNLAEETITEKEMDGGGSDLFLNKYPVSSFTKLELNNGSWATPNWIEVVTGDYKVYTGQGRVHTHPAFIEGHQNYRVTYTGGYTIIPADIQLLTNQLVSKTYSERNTQGIKRVAVEGSSIEYNLATEAEFTSDQKQTISRYANISI